MDFWRRSTRESKEGQIRKSTMRETLGVKKNILEVIEERRLSWYDCVKRKSDFRVPTNFEGGRQTK